MAFKGYTCIEKPDFIVDMKSKRVFIHIKKDGLTDFDLIRSQAQFRNFCDEHSLNDFRQAVITRSTSGPETMKYAIDKGILLIIAQDTGAEELIAKMGVSNLKRF